MADKKGEKSAVKVMVRVRPFNGRELAPYENENEYPTSIVLMDGPTVKVVDTEGMVKDVFDFHETFWSIPESQRQFTNKPFADQEAVFEVTGKPAVEAALAGKHVCIFAYGQTGSGKTYTMLGSEEDPGISPRIVDMLFEELETMSSRVGQGFKYTVEISFMEIYNEKVKDLLEKEAEDRERERDRPESPPLRRQQSRRRSSVAIRRKSFAANAEEDYKELKVRNSPTIGVFVEGLTRLGVEQGICTASDVKRVMRFGMEHRATAETNMNATSSRSHAIFQLCVRAKNEAKGIQRYANINLVDLAGSERISLSGVEGQRLVEATKINLSLSTLRRVIDILIENSQRKRGQPKQIPPYRDAMLTWILSESLGGNSVTMMLATVSPAEGNREDTVNTLRYADKAKSIVNTVRVNEERGNVVLGAMQREVEELRRQLEEAEMSADAQMVNDLTGQIESLKAQQEDHITQHQEALEAIEREKELLEQSEEKVLIMEREVEQLKKEGIHEKAEKAKEEFDRKQAELEEKRRVAEKVAEEHRQTIERLSRAQTELDELEQMKSEVARRQSLFKNEVHAVKRKQFALAFHKAFARAGTSSGLEKLEAEIRQLKELTSKLELDLDERSSEAMRLKHTNVILEERRKNVDDEIASTKRIQEMANESHKERIANLQDAKKAAEDALLVVREKHSSVQKRLKTLSSQLEQDAAGLRDRLANLSSRHESLTAERAKKRELLLQLRRQAEALRAESASIQSENSRILKKKHEGEHRVMDLRPQNASLKAHNASLTTELQGLLEKSLLADREKSMLSERAADLTAVVNELSKNHGELKKFVSYRFFAPGSCGSDRSPPSSPRQLDGNFEGDRLWVNSGYIYRSKSPLRSTSPLRPMTPGRLHTSSPAPTARKASSTPNSTIRRTRSPGVSPSPTVRNSAFPLRRSPVQR